MTYALIAMFATFAAPDLLTPGAHGVVVHNALVDLGPSAVAPEGLLGGRMHASLVNRLLAQDPDVLLAPFRDRNRDWGYGWPGEYVGKWLDAASLTYALTGDARLAARCRAVATAFIATQEPDGYLGTYPAAHRYVVPIQGPYDWDVWITKYGLLGLLRYWQVFGDDKALTAARKSADLLLASFGPGRKDIIAAGTHFGLAATSVLQPMVWLYRATGDKRYLDFCNYILTAYDQPNGSHLVSALLAHTPVNRIANAKAYEMLSNIVGLAELYRVTGRADLLRAVDNAWDDVSRNRLYITGGASSGEVFQPDDRFPPDASAAPQETCVTATWIQLSLDLLRLTGDAKYAEAVEYSTYNELLGAQLPDGSQWSYYVPLQGLKPYSRDLHCCSSSGIRAVAWAPFAAVMKREKPEAIVINFYEPGTYKVPLSTGVATVTIRGSYPLPGDVTVTVSGAGKVPVFYRGRPLHGAISIAPFVPRPEAVDGGAAYPSKVAFRYGPLVLAYDSAANSKLPAHSAKMIRLTPDALPTFADGAFTVPATLLRPTPHPVTLSLRPWYSAGSTGGAVQVWLDREGVPAPEMSVFFGAHESWSAEGNVLGSLCDDDPETYRVTFNGQPQADAWFAVALDAPATFSHLRFVHGQTFHDGGWYDASAGKPRFQIKEAPTSDWRDVGILDTYPATTATDAAGLRAGEAFDLILPAPVKAVALRILGKPATGDNPAQAFSSCAELAAF